MEKVRKELIFIGMLFLFVGVIYWLPSYLDDDSKHDGLLQLQVFANYAILVLSVLPFYRYVFKYHKPKTLCDIAKIHMVSCPVYIMCWYTLGRKFYHLIGGTYVYGNRFHHDFYRNDLYCDVYNTLLIYILLFLCFHTYHYYLELQESKKRENQLMALTYRNEINALKADIQPLFLLRSLKEIRQGIPAEHHHTRDLITRLTDIIQFSLNVSGKESIKLRDEILFIKSYLSLEQERFKNKIKVVYDIAAEAMGIEVPPMLIQPLVENAVKHGIEKNVNGGTIKLSVVVKGNYLNISVSDTGKGLIDISDPGLFTKGIGLGNIKQRVKKLFNEDVQVQYNNPNGLKVFYKIPL